MLKQFFLFAFMFVSLTCKDEGIETPPTPVRVKLTLIDVSVTESFLHVKIDRPASNETLFLQRLPAGQAGNGTTVISFAAVADTNIADTALAPNTSYSYTATLQTNGNLTSTSNIISAQTLLPTSHNFTWRTYLLGDGNNSALNDVAIVNDSLIYAVGELYLRDSTGQEDPAAYNVARWNSRRWELLRIQFYTFCGQIDTGSYPAKSIFAFGSTDIWIGMDGSQVVRWNGQSQSAAKCIPVSVNKLWGISSTDLYAVGYGGGIAHYNGNTWQRVESGTSSIILDAWGTTNPVTRKEEVYCAVSSFFEPNADKKILKIYNMTLVDSVPWTSRLLDGVWTNKGFPLFTAGDGMFQNGSGRWQLINAGATIYTNKIRGTGLNNIVAVGDFGFITHFNGVDWQMVGYDYDAGYGSVAVTSMLVIAVGRKNGRALVTIGSREERISNKNRLGVATPRRHYSTEIEDGVSVNTCHSLFLLP